MDATQQRAVLTICLMAAFADGGNDDRERAHIKEIAGLLGETTAETKVGLLRLIELLRREHD